MANYVELATISTTTSITYDERGPFTDVAFFGTTTSITYDERGPFTDAGTVVSTTTELIVEVHTLFDEDTIETISGFDPTVVDTYTVATRDYYNNPWNVTVTYDSSFPTAGSIGTADDNGKL